MTAPRSIALLACLLAGCATYRARPLEQADPAARFNARRLDEPAVLAVLDSAGLHPDLPRWRSAELAEAAWIIRPERSRVAAERRVAEAARRTAGAREPLGIASETEYSFSGTNGESRWGLTVSGIFTVSLGGKRGARLARATAGALLAAARADEEAWATRWRVREAVEQVAGRARERDALQEERHLADSVRLTLERGYQSGGIGGREVARATLEARDLDADLAGATRLLAESHAALAAALGVPGAAMDGLVLLVPRDTSCAGGLSREAIQTRALSARPELRSVLAAYQVAEADVRLEVAASWPDLQLGPGLFFDHGVGKWTVGFGLPSLPRGGNRGPIEEAEARREVAAARVEEMQTQVLTELESALLACRAAEAEFRALDPADVLRQRALAESAYTRGETGRLEPIQAAVATTRLLRRRAEVQVTLSRARLALAEAAGQWELAPPGTEEEIR